MKKKTTEEFIINAKIKHGEIYDYSKVFYKGNKIKVKIICKTHGIFEQRPDDHLNGHGCSKCVLKNKKNKESFINEALSRHGNKYDYNLVEYKSVHEKVKIICKTHGVFEQIAHGHLNGQGCPKCYGNKKLTQIEVLKRFKEVHGDRYDYSKVNYKNKFSK